MSRIKIKVRLLLQFEMSKGRKDAILSSNFIPGDVAIVNENRKNLFSHGMCSTC